MPTIIFGNYGDVFVFYKENAKLEDCNEHQFSKFNIEETVNFLDLRLRIGKEMYLIDLL